MGSNKMGSNTRLYDKFQGYTLDDCACDACLYSTRKGKACSLEVCCCAEEKAAALLREVAEENQRAAASADMVLGAKLLASAGKLVSGSAGIAVGRVD